MTRNYLSRVLAGSLLFTAAPGVQAQEANNQNFAVIMNAQQGDNDPTPFGQNPAADSQEGNEKVGARAGQKRDRNGNLYTEAPEDFQARDKVAVAGKFKGQPINGMKFTFGEDGFGLKDDTENAAASATVADAFEATDNNLVDADGDGRDDVTGETQALRDARVANGQTAEQFLEERGGQPLTAEEATAAEEGLQTAAAPGQVPEDQGNAPNAGDTESPSNSNVDAEGNPTEPTGGNFSPDTWTVTDTNTGDVLSAPEGSTTLDTAALNNDPSQPNNSSFPQPGSFEIQNEGIIEEPPAEKDPPEIPPEEGDDKEVTEINSGGSEGQDEDEPDQDVDIEITEEGEEDPEEKVVTEIDEEDEELDDKKSEKQRVVANEANTVILDRTVANLLLAFVEEATGFVSVISAEEDPENLNAHPGTKTVALGQEGPHFFASIASGEIPDPEEVSLETKIFDSPLEDHEGPQTVEMLIEGDNPVSLAEIVSDALYFQAGARLSYELSFTDNFEGDPDIPAATDENGEPVLDEEGNPVKEWWRLDHIVRVNTNNDAGVDHEMDQKDGATTGTLLFRTANFDPSADAGDDSEQEDSDDANQDDGITSDAMEDGSQEGEDSSDTSDDSSQDDTSDDTAQDDTSDSDSVAGEGEEIRYTFKVEVQDSAGNELTLECPINVYDADFEVNELSSGE